MKCSEKKKQNGVSSNDLFIKVALICELRKIVNTYLDLYGCFDSLVIIHWFTCFTELIEICNNYT